MCTVRYRNIGCYNDHHFRERPLSDLLFSTAKTDCLEDLERLPTNETLDTWNEYIYNLVCLCAEKAKEGKYTYFGLQNCGKFAQVFARAHN